MRHLTIYLLLGILLSSCTDKNLKALAEDPIAGDLYEVKLDNDLYTVYWVISVMNDTVIFRRQIKETTDRKELKNLIQDDIDNIYFDKRGTYELDFFSYTTTQIQDAVKNGKILQINRMTKFRKSKQ